MKTPFTRSDIQHRLDKAGELFLVAKDAFLYWIREISEQQVKDVIPGHQEARMVKWEATEQYSYLALKSWDLVIVYRLGSGIMLRVTLEVLDEDVNLVNVSYQSNPAEAWPTWVYDWEAPIGGTQYLLPPECQDLRIVMESVLCKKCLDKGAYFAEVRVGKLYESILRECDCDKGALRDA